MNRNSFKNILRYIVERKHAFKRKQNPQYDISNKKTVNNLVTKMMSPY